MIRNSFGARDKLNVSDSTFEIFRLDALEGATRLPYNLKVLLENLLRNEDGHLITIDQINALRNWDACGDTEHGNPVHASQSADAGLYRRAVRGRHGRDA